MKSSNVLSDFLGQTTGTFDQDGSLKSGPLSSSLSGTQLSLKFPTFTFEYGRRIADGLAGEAGFGDNVTMYSASIGVVKNVQHYDLQKIVQSASLDGSAMGTEFTGSVNNKKITVHRVYYKSPATMWRFYGYYGSLNVMGNMSTYGMYADDSTFEMVPSWQNKLQAMQYETDLYTRASHYSYEIKNNKITVYPVPGEPGTITPKKIWFHFSIPKNAWEEDSDRLTGIDGINNINTLPFANIPYENINSMGKQWIRKYSLAIAKEMLAQIRGKFGTIPIPGNDITLNAADLAGQAKEEQTVLKEELKVLLETVTYSSLVATDGEMSENAAKIQTSVPMGVYIG